MTDLALALHLLGAASVGFALGRVPYTALWYRVFPPLTFIPAPPPPQPATLPDIPVAVLPPSTPIEEYNPELDPRFQEESQPDIQPATPDFRARCILSDHKGKTVHSVRTFGHTRYPETFNRGQGRLYHFHHIDDAGDRHYWLKK